MTPVAEATEVVAAGGPINVASLESDLSVAQAGTIRARLTYVPFEWHGPSYVANVAPARLTAIISASDEGFVAECPELNSLGYGADERSALDDLIDSTCEYLTFLLEKQPELAPEVSHHALYLALLEVPARSWFAAVHMPPAAADAS
jgi:hypothetical protein